MAERSREHRIRGNAGRRNPLPVLSHTDARHREDRPFHVMAKPAGAICNLDCAYCYYLEKESLYDPGSSFRMDDELLETYIRQYIAAQDTPEVVFVWQGGEPTLMGLDFFRNAVALQRRYADGKRIGNAIQTNGVRLDDAWCEFFAAHDFLVGLSIDGPPRLHDAYRVDKGGKPTASKVLAGLARLREHEVEFNTLTVVHQKNAPYPLEVYRYLKERGSRHLQFIPLVERKPDPDEAARGLAHASPPETGAVVDGAVTPASVDARAYGDFMLAIFEEWVRHDVGRVFVQLFDITLAAWVGAEPPLCVFRETCGDALALEHNGDLYSCDHYVYPQYRLGNIQNTPLSDLARGHRQDDFGDAKRDSLPRYCRECEVRFVCNGGCPKHRFITTPDGEPGLNYLCAGYKRFFTRTAPAMRTMAALLERERPPAEIMELMAAQDRTRAVAAAGRNDPCPCGSGKKTKRCCDTSA